MGTDTFVEILLAPRSTPFARNAVFGDWRCRGMATKQTRRQPARALRSQGGIPSTSHSGAASPFLTKDPAAAHAHFLPQVQAIPADSVRRISVDPSLARHNVEVGVTYFASIQAEVVKVLPACPVAQYLELPTLALGLIFASDQIVEKASDGEIHRRLAECGKLRSPTLRMLEIFADPEVGLADPDVVRAIRAGTGGMDKARDAVNIAAYFRKLGPSIAGKHPFTDEQIAALSEVGQWLIPQLTPPEAVVGPLPTDPKAIERDRFWTLLWTRYDQLRGAVAAVRGLNGLDDLVPSLGTRVAAARKAKTEPAAGPGVPPDAAASAPAPAIK